MATGKLRSSKRNSSSSSSYMSTITMVVFIGLCGLGLWMLTSSSAVPPQSVHTSTNSFSHSNDHHHVVNSRKDRKVPSFDDTPGDLPDDAVKEDNTNSNNSNGDQEDTSINNKSDEDSKANNEDNNEQENNKDGSSSDGNEDNSSSKESAEEEQQQQKQEENLQSNTSGDSDNNNGNGSENENQEISTQTNTDTESKDEDQNNQELQQSHEEQIQQDPEVITTKENTEQSIQQQDPELESKDNPNQALQQESDTDNSQQSDSSSGGGGGGGGDENQTQTQSSEEEDNNQQTQEESSTTGSDENQQQNSQPEIQEVTNDESQSQTQEDNQRQQNSDTTTSSNDEPQQTQTNEEEQSQQSENQEQQQNRESETSTESNQEETTQGTEDIPTESNTGDSFPTGAHAGIPKESKDSNRAWSTQADQSENQKERRKDGSNGNKDGSMYGYTWELCNVTSGADYIPCLDNEKAIKMIHYTGHFEHRERHCPEDPPTCLVPMPTGYKKTIEWPKSRDKIWYHNVPHTKLAEVKGHQNWVKVTGEFLTFPGGGTQFIHGALHYIDFIQKSLPNIAWGKRTRVILDVGCGVASFGGYLFERDVLAMSFAPKDEHEAQVQFALERGIPAISAVMGSQRLPFPSRVFDLVHCARCRVPWHAEGGRLLLELNRVLRPGGYFVWSATPVYQKLPEDVEIWKAMSALTISMCWELFTIKKDRLNSVGAAIYRKPTSNDCYEQRKHNNPPICKGDDDANAAWYVPLQACIHRVPTNEVERGAQWPEEWPARVHKAPYCFRRSKMNIHQS
ncbi:hypothetical protein MKX01_023794 [Papaver californicum]|nr:hypothetical protein MKX01_023794 [Papaver californicum]